MHILNNHPVHIKDDKTGLSPSAFIPYCSFGNDFELMGKKIENFSSPVCNSFKAVRHKDQLCYEVEMDKFKIKGKVREQLEKGLVLLLDYNEDKSMIDSTLYETDDVKLNMNTISMNNDKLDIYFIS